MNNTFNINRFGLLVRKQWLEYGKLYLIVFGIVAGVLLAIYSYMYWEITQMESKYSINLSLQLNFRWPLFILFGILFLTLAANHYFAPLGQKSKAILELTLPASSLEKFLVGALFSCLFALLSYILLFYLVDMAFVSKLRSLFPTAFSNEGSNLTTSGRIPEYFFDRILSKPELRFTFFSGPVLLSSIFILGSLFFKKFQYIKTTITTIVFLSIWATYLAYSGRYLFRNKISTNANSQLGLSHLQMEWLITGILLSLTLIIMVIAYVRFKEKEV